LADPFPRVEREPQQFPIQRDVPAPRKTSLSILERQSQAIAELEASPDDAIVTVGEQSPTTPTATETSSGSQTTARVEREPQQFPIQRDVPAPRKTSLSILERQSQAIAEVEASPDDAIVTAGEQSPTTPTATETSSGSQTTDVPSLPFREQDQRDQKADARVASSNPVPEIAPQTQSQSQSQQRSRRPQRGAAPSPDKTGAVLEIWYGEKQVFQSRNAPTGQPMKSIAQGETPDTLLATPDDQQGETEENEENQSGVSFADATAENEATDETGETPENEQIDQPMLVELLQNSDHELELDDVGNSSAPRHANDDSKPFIPLTHAAWELAPVPLNGPKNFPQAEEEQGRIFQPVVNSAFPDASGDATGRAIRQTKFEDATLAAPSGLSTPDDNLQRGGVIQAANSTEHADTNDESLWRNHQGRIPQSDIAQLLASPGTVLSPVVAIAFGLAVCVSVVLLFLLIALRIMRPGQQLPLCSVSVVNGDRVLESGFELEASSDQGAHRGTRRDVPAEYSVSHRPRRVGQSEPHPPARSGLAKKTIEAATYDSGFRPGSQPLPQATEPFVSRDGMMDDVLRQNLAIRDQFPRKWAEN
jgi:hypothetical protein